MSACALVTTGVSASPQVAPLRCGCLRVEVDEHCGMPSSLCGDRGRAGERGFAGAPLLADECESQHPITILC